MKPETVAVNPASASLGLKSQDSIQTWGVWHAQKPKAETTGTRAKLTTSLTPVTQAASTSYNTSYHEQHA